MLRSNKSLFEISENYREIQLMEYEDVDFLVRYMQDRFLMTPSETISEIYNNY